MMKRALLIGLSVGVGCGDDGGQNRMDSNGGGMVAATAKLYNGATPAGTAFFAPPPPPAPPENGQWLATPTKLTMTLTKIILDPAGGMNTVDCPVTWDASQPGMTELATCPFAVPAGTYDTLSVAFSTTVKVTISDAAAGLYTTTTGVQITEPVGGAQELTYMIGGAAGETGTSPLKLPQPVTVAEGSPLVVSVVIDALQAMRLTVNGSAVTLGHVTSPFPNDPGRPDIIATAGQLAKIKTYTGPGLLTAGSYCAGMCTSQPPGGITAVSVFYNSSTTVAMVGMRLNGTPSNCAQQLFPAFCNDAKCYVGRDSGGVVGWAVGANPQFTEYSALFAMPQATAIGGTADLYCMNTTTDPMPAGGSFASGAPSIQTSGNSLGTYTLVAQ